MLNFSKTETQSMPTLELNQTYSNQSSLPPNYYGDAEFIELGAVTPASANSMMFLPKYESLHRHGPSDIASNESFHATRILQIESAGHPLVAFPVPRRPCPIRVYEVLPGDEIGPEVYTSLRTTRRSGNSLLVRAGDSAETVLCSTTYRFGPNRPPRIRLHGAASVPADPESSPTAGHEEDFEVIGRGCITRSQIIRTHLGTFIWRYADREERRAEGADNLLVLEKISTIALEGGKQDERRRRIAQLVRSKELRSKHTYRTTAGNGGRLMIDMREWASEKGAVKQLDALIVASCLVMLKKEVDRRRLMQAMVIAGAAGSG